MSQRDIAARLRISEPAVSQIIARAMDRVRGVLGNCQHIEQREAILALLN